MLKAKKQKKPNLSLLPPGVKVVPPPKNAALKGPELYESGGVNTILHKNLAASKAASSQTT